MLDVTAGIHLLQNFGMPWSREAREITGIGNCLRIRHSETSQEMLATSEHADYLFYRLYSFIQLTLRSR